MTQWVTKPAARLRINVATRRPTANGQPRNAALMKKISGSIVGEATQNAITGANGTPPINIEAITGTTLQEQKGPKAPAAVASKIPMIGRRPKAPVSRFETPDTRRITANGMLIANSGQTWLRSWRTILPICSRADMSLLVWCPPRGGASSRQRPGQISMPRRNRSGNIFRRRLVPRRSGRPL